MDPAQRLFRLLMRLYPRRYRERYGAEMEAFFRQEREAGEGGVFYWIRLVMDHGRASHAVRRGAGDGMLRRAWEDLAGGVRALMRAPTFALFAVFTLALGIGATTAVFGVLDRVVLRPLPYPASDRMVLLGIDARHDPGGLGPLSAALMVRLQEAPGPAETVVAATSGGTVLRDGSEPVRTQVTRVTRGFFPFFGAWPAVGRLLGDADYDAGAANVVVLGNENWRERYGGDPGVVGRTLRLDDEVFTIVGVLAGDFVPPPELVEDRDLWTPLALSGEAMAPGTFFLAGAARLRPGVTISDFDAYADRVVQEVHADESSDFLLGGSVASYRDSVVGPISGMLGRVMAAASLLLLIACVNVASLLLSRGTRRAHEIAVRAALGAGRVRLARQLLGESIGIAAGAALLGSVWAWGAVELFRSHAPAGLPRLEEVVVDLRGLGFSLAVAMGTVLLFGLLPALRSTRATGPGAEVLTRKATAGRREGRLLGALITLETALAVVLAVGSGLLAHDLVRITREDPGFRPDGLVTMRLSLEPRFQRNEWTGVWERLVEGAGGLPGVTAAAVATQAPYAGTRVASMFVPEGAEREEGEDFVILVTVGGDYVGTLGTRLVEGRGFDAADDGSTPVALVNQAFVRRHWPGESAVGKRVRSGGPDADDEPSYQVVGVLADVRTRAGAATPPHLFLPLREAPFADMEILLRTEGDVAALALALRDVVRRVDPTVPVTRIGTVESLASQGLTRPRFYTSLFGSFAAVALLLAVVGVYGTTSYATTTRVREIGIRLALGARSGQVVGAAVARTGAVVTFGVALGLAAALVGSRVMAGVLTYVTPWDAPTYTAVALVTLSAGIVAGWLPAGRAGRVDPATTLREE